MTHALDIRERSPAHLATAPAASAAETAGIGKFGTFAITFGIAFVILYTVFERLNWPLFTYHPAVGKLDFWMQRPRSGEGPPMYWYGWLALALPAAVVMAWIATAVSRRRLLRATIFSCVLAALWPAIFAIWALVDLRSSFDDDVVKSIAWMSAIPGFAGAAAAGYFIPIEWAQRLWTKLLLAVPIVSLVVLAVSLKTYFLR
jgi:hypothetical protein